jgi:hypothetical protein
MRLRGALDLPHGGDVTPLRHLCEKRPDHAADARDQIFRPAHEAQH